MKKTIIGIIAFAFTLLTSQTTQAQGTMTYVSSLSAASTGSASVGSDSWLAVLFGTGTNAGGYALDSIQLGMADASGSPSNFMVMLYSQSHNPTGIDPGSSLGTLEGSLSPTAAGIYTYTPASNMTLLPNNNYFIVLTAGTTIANGAYNWSESAFPPSIYDWATGNGVLQSDPTPLGWHPTPYLGIGQFAINATAIPEPGVLGLFGLASLAFLWHRRKAKAV